MFCPRCGREHRSGAVTCPHCGAPLPETVKTPSDSAGRAADSPPGGPVDEAAAEEKARQAELMQRFEAVLEAEKTKPAGRRPAPKVMGGVMGVIILLTGGLGFFLRFKATSTVSHATQPYNYSVPTQPDSRALYGSAQDEAGAVQAAQQYAARVGMPGLTQDYVSVYGDYADVWLKDPASGTQYDVTLMKSLTGKGWSVLGMTEI